jgi:hypothetical protein
LLQVAIYHCYTAAGVHNLGRPQIPFTELPTFPSGDASPALLLGRSRRLWPFHVSRHSPSAKNEVVFQVQVYQINLIVVSKKFTALSPTIRRMAKLSCKSGQTFLPFAPVDYNVRHVVRLPTTPFLVGSSWFSTLYHTSEADNVPHLTCTKSSSLRVVKRAFGPT